MYPAMGLIDHLDKLVEVDQLLDRTAPSKPLKAQLNMTDPLKHLSAPSLHKRPHGHGRSRT